MPDIGWLHSLFFLLLLIGTLLLEVLVSQLHYVLTGKGFRRYHFSFIRYLFVLLPPLVATVYLILAGNEGGTLLKFFLIFAVIGTLLEGLVGFVYQMTVGHRLWSYHRYAIAGYTSLLAIPYWGFVGVLAYALINLLA